MTSKVLAVMSVVGLGVTPGLAQQDLFWGRQVGTPQLDVFWGAAPDGAGGVFVDGYTFGLLGDSQFGGADVILGRYDADGNQVWMKQFGTVETETSTNVCPDGAGGVFMSGRTEGDLGGPFKGGDNDGWIGRFDADGGELWLVQIGTPENDQAWNVLPDGSGGVFVTGWTTGDLGGPSAGAADCFVARYDADGKQCWITQFGSSTDELSFAIASDGAGGVFVGGNTKGDLGGPNQGVVDAWIAHFDADGDQIGDIIQFGTSWWDEVRGLVADGEGGVFACGMTAGELFGEEWHGETDGYVARFDSSLGLLWSTQDGTLDWEQWYSVIPDGQGGVLISGDTGGDFADVNAGGNDGVIARYNEGGLVWKEQFGSAGHDFGFKIVSDDAGGAYVAGVAGDELFGEHQGNFDVILARFGCAADLDGDGDTDADDFFAYLDAFAGGNTDVCDIDGDGDCDADDFFGYLDLFAKGCP